MWFSTLPTTVLIYIYSLVFLKDLKILSGIIAPLRCSDQIRRYLIYRMASTILQKGRSLLPNEQHKMICLQASQTCLRAIVAWVWHKVYYLKALLYSNLLAQGSIMNKRTCLTGILRQVQTVLALRISIVQPKIYPLRTVTLLLLLFRKVLSLKI